MFGVWDVGPWVRGFRAVVMATVAAPAIVVPTRSNDSSY